ncbi:esterase/lipase family protein [Streptomyces sp. NPDC053048]|uniref:esterase/lipase family protein n=1 Tax=Streptomyces sp. NPDC053048 TaxID=3365694 RepID=UPI0037D0BC0B
MRRLLVASLSLVLAAVALGAAPPALAAAGGPPDPVVFVHGANAGPGVWGEMRADFLRAGYPADRLAAWSYDTRQSTNEVLAGRLSAYVDQVLARTGASRVDFVTHSLGGLPSRWYVTFGGGADKVAHWVSLAGPNHGTHTAWACALVNQGCRDMTPGSYVLKRLNAGDETPGATRYGTWWSPCDEAVAPVSSTALEGAVNSRADTCPTHNGLLTDDTVSRQVRAFLART